MTSKQVTATDVFGNTSQVDVKDLSWRPSVYGIVIEDDKIALVPQHKPGFFDVPGGGVYLGEDLEKAVIREVKEETGLDVEVVKLAGLKSNIFAATHATGNVYHSILIYYVCKKIGGELSTDGFDEFEKNYAGLAQWIPVADIDSIGLASSVDYRDIIKECLNSGH
jgi:ADP-ribose pyrophosphatase YjhB (NUDIX family)